MPLFPESAPAPTPGPAPQDMSGDVPSQLPTIDPPQPQAAPAPAPSVESQAAARTSRWRGVLMGLANGGIPAAVAGAVDPNGAQTTFNQRKDLAQARVDMAKSRVKFESAAAASAMSDAVQKDFNLSHLSEDWKNQQQENALNQIKTLANQGVQPYLVSEDDGKTVKANLEDITAKTGGVPPLFTVHLGSKVISYNVNDLIKGQQPPPILNDVAPYANLPQVDAAQWAMLTPGQRASAVMEAMNFWNPVPDPKNIDSQIATYTTLRDTYGFRNIGANGQKSNDASVSLAKFDRVIASLKSARDEFDAHAAKLKQLGAQATAEGKAAGTPDKPAKPTKEKIENMVVGSMPDGSQVAGTADELKAAGASGIMKLPSADASKVVVSRQLVAPGGLFTAVAADIKNLEAKGKLGIVGSRWGDFLSGKIGSDPDFGPLRTNMGLLSTALLQAHVGAKGGEGFMHHFEGLANWKVDDAATLKAQLRAEYNYVQHKAMLPQHPTQGGK